ncbi:MAG: hypothetical protein MK085_06035 [Phycisphaerales bacterium]|nr:hypothetical protein [Phycisphaerales bacterium]
MPAILQWFLTLLPTNPICLRLVQGGSKRTRHLYVRSGYLAILMVVLLLSLLGPAQSLRELAQRGAIAFNIVAFGQVALICLLTPVFMAGAIAQEANPRTWDILLTTPLNTLQIVLGNLFGRLFFVLALLFSSLPLFLFVQYFGGVPGTSILLSYLVAGCSAFIVASIAVTLSVTRTAGRRAVFVFYVSVVLYLFITWGIDFRLREAVSVGSAATFTTLMTPLNPFLSLEALLSSNTYVPRDLGPDAFGLARWWFAAPVSAFCWLSIGVSVFLILFSTLRMRVIGAKVGTVPWYRRLFGLGAKGATARTPRKVGKNPISWRESSSHTMSVAGVVGRWGFIALGLAAACSVIGFFHAGGMGLADLRASLLILVSAEVTIVVLAAMNMSATAVSREREDGTLDLILTTPIQPGPYLAGKLRGLVMYLLPMLMVPVVTMFLAAIYCLTQGSATMIPVAVGTATIPVPIMSMSSSIAMLLLLPPFVAFAVMVGLQWSIRSKGTISSVIAAVMVLMAVVGVLGLCGMASGRGIPYLGAAVSAGSPFNLIFASFMPAAAIPETLQEAQDTFGVSLLVGAAVSAVIYIGIVLGMHASMKKSFMMTVRRLAGTR